MISIDISVLQISGLLALLAFLYCACVFFETQINR